MKRILIFAVIAVLVLLPGCEKDNGKKAESLADFPVKIGKVTVARMPDKIVSLSPSITEIIFSLGADTKLAGVSDFCGFEDKTAALPKLGTAMNPDLEEIIKLSPDVIFSSFALSDDDKAALDKQKIPVVVLGAAADFSELQALYRSVSLVISGNSSGPVNAVNTYERIRGDIDGITVGQGEPVSKAVYILSLNSDGSAAYILSGKSLGGKLVEAAGVFNIGAGLQGLTMHLTDIAAANPDFIFCDPEAVSAVKSSKALADVKAVKNGKVAGINSELIDRQGVNMVEAVRQMAEIVVPKESASGAESSLPPGN